MEARFRHLNLQHYRILSKLGAGGMGEVYLAHDARLDRKVALKILPADLAIDSERMRRFVQEAKAAAADNLPIASIAVLPFQNNSADQETQCLSGRRN